MEKIPVHSLCSQRKLFLALKSHLKLNFLNLSHFAFSSCLSLAFAADNALLCMCWRICVREFPASLCHSSWFSFSAPLALIEKWSENCCGIIVKYLTFESVKCVSVAYFCYISLRLLLQHTFPSCSNIFTLSLAEKRNN
jgi:hypothetical protein